MRRATLVLVIGLLTACSARPRTAVTSPPTEPAIGSVPATEPGTTAITYGTSDACYPERSCPTATVSESELHALQEHLRTLGLQSDLRTIRCMFSRAGVGPNGSDSAPQFVVALAAGVTPPVVGVHGDAPAGDRAELQGTVHACGLGEDVVTALVRVDEPTTSSASSAQAGP